MNPEGEPVHDHSIRAELREATSADPLEAALASIRAELGLLRERRDTVRVELDELVEQIRKCERILAVVEPKPKKPAVKPAEKKKPKTDPVAQILPEKRDRVLAAISGRGPLQITQVVEVSGADRQTVTRALKAGHVMGVVRHVGWAPPIGSPNGRGRALLYQVDRYGTGDRVET
jgi:hypothetical protein